MGFLCVPKGEETAVLSTFTLTRWRDASDFRSRNELHVSFLSIPYLPRRKRGLCEFYTISEFWAQCENTNTIF